MKTYDFLVGIKCYTYNQSKYITDALNGFTMQQTTFPYVAMVVDDASTDGEQDVIAAYVEKYFDIKNSNIAYKKETDYAYITFAQHKTNPNCYIVVLYLKENHYRKKWGYKKNEYLTTWRGNIKYEALCEGDDYWIDPLKLQKQVDFLENNPEYGLVHTAFQFVDANNNILPTPDIPLYRNLEKRIRNGYVWDYLLINKGFILTCTIMYDKDLLDIKEKAIIDHGTFLMMSRKTKVYYLNDVTSAYRRNPTGIMLSSHNIVSDNMKHVLLNQLYYYHSNDYSTLKHYKTSIPSFYRRMECFASIIIRSVRNKGLEYNKLIFIIKKNPLYVVFFPILSIIVIVKKLILNK
jgi:hypothetical protein